jgi:hypothetical protein
MDSACVFGVSPSASGHSVAVTPDRFVQAGFLESGPKGHEHLFIYVSAPLRSPPVIPAELHLSGLLADWRAQHSTATQCDDRIADPVT